jgi:hypothetical protein
MPPPSRSLSPAAAAAAPCQVRPQLLVASMCCCSSPIRYGGVEEPQGSKAGSARATDCWAGLLCSLLTLPVHACACAGALHPALPARLGCAAGHALGVVDAGCWSGGLLPGGAMACWAMTPRRQSPVFAPHTCREGKPPRPYSPEALRRVFQACLHQVRPLAHAAGQRWAAAKGRAMMMNMQLSAGGGAFGY